MLSGDISRATQGTKKLVEPQLEFTKANAAAGDIADSLGTIPDGRDQKSTTPSSSREDLRSISPIELPPRESLDEVRLSDGLKDEISTQKQNLKEGAQALNTTLNQAISNSKKEAAVLPIETDVTAFNAIIDPMSQLLDQWIEASGSLKIELLDFPEEEDGEIDYFEAAEIDLSEEEESKLMDQPTRLLPGNPTRDYLDCLGEQVEELSAALRSIKEIEYTASLAVRFRADEAESDEYDGGYTSQTMENLGGCVDGFKDLFETLGQYIRGLEGEDPVDEALLEKSKTTALNLVELELRFFQSTTGVFSKCHVLAKQQERPNKSHIQNYSDTFVVGRPTSLAQRLRPLHIFRAEIEAKRPAWVSAIYE